MIERIPSGVVRAMDEKISNIEKHRRTKNSLLELINGLEDGDPIPSERALAAKFGVARMTLRKVIDTLIGEGYLRKIPDKGTFITRSHPVRVDGRQPFAYFGSHELSAAHAEVLEITEEPAGARIGQHLQLAPAAKVTKIVRVNFVLQEPVAIEHIHVPSSLFPSLKSEDFKSFLIDDLYEQRYRIRLVKSHQILRVTSINKFESKHLNTPQHSPAFFVTTTKSTIDSRVFEYTRAVYRGDRYHFVNDATLGGSHDAETVDSNKISFNPYFRIS